MKRNYILPALLVFVTAFFSACSQAPAPQPAEKTMSVTEGSRPDSNFFYLKFRRLIAENHFGQAEVALEKAIEMDDSSSFLKQELIRLYHQQGRESEALALAETLAKEAPDNVDNLLILVLLKKGQEDDPQFEELLKRILVLDPKNKETYLRLGKWYIDHEDYTTANELFQKMVKEFPNDYVAYFYLGETLFTDGKNEEAQKAFSKTIELEPDLVEPRFRLIELLGELPPSTQVKKQILDQFQQIMDVDPDNDRVAFETALFYYHNGDTQKAEELFARLSQEARKNPRLVISAVDAFIARKRYEDAVIVFSQLAKDNSADSNLNFFLGMAYEGLGDIDQAIENYLKVTPDHPQYKKTILSIAFLYRDQDKPDLAIQFLEQHHAQSPNDIDILTYLASFYEDEGKFSKAMTLIRQGLEVSRDNATLLFKLGAVQDKAGLRDESIKTMESLLRIDPDNASALNYLGYTYAEMGIRLDEALELVQHALSIKPNDGYITDSLGWVYFKKKEYEKAAFYLEKAVKISRSETIITAHLADVYVQMGRYALALNLYREAIENAKEDQTREIREIKDKIKALESSGHAAP